MDDNDGRRSRVPAGTFGDSTPPPADLEAEAAEGGDRRRFTSTLTGKGAFGDTVPPPIPAPHRVPSQRTGNTLLGHPATPPAVPTTPGSVLAPPKWRGAKPYLEGEEPQPRISSIPTPPPSPVPPVPSDAMRSKVTTKVGHPVAQPPSPPAIDDTIQRMLETQASVPMQDEESSEGDSIPEIPFDQLPIEQLEDSLPRVPKTTLSAVRAADVQASAGRNAESDPPVAAKPAADESALAAARRNAASGGIAPAEVIRQPRKGDSQAALGFLAVAVFALLFVGGWFITRGGYQPRKPVAAAAPPAAAAEPSAANDLAKAPPIAQQQAAPAAAPAAALQPSASASDASEPAVKRAPRRIRTAAEPALAPPAPAARNDDAQPAASDNGTAPALRGGAASVPAVLTVKPRIDPENLPDIPGRDDVIAALEPLRPAIDECGRGTHGIAQLDITVSNSGAVTHAVVGGDFAGTAEGSCIARAARSAQFGPFKKPRFRVIYPFSL